MSEKVQIGGTGYALGLQWARLLSSKVDNEIQSEVRRAGVNVGVKRVVASEDGTRYQLGLASDGSHKGLVAAAGLIASVHDTAICIQSTDAGYWIAGISDSEVLAGYDYVTDSSEDVGGKADELFELLSEAGADFTILVDEGSAALLSDSLREQAEEKGLVSLDTLFEDSRVNEALIKENRLVRFVDKIKIAKIAVAGLAVVFVLNMYLDDDDDFVVDEPMIEQPPPPPSEPDEPEPEGPSIDEIMEEAAQQERQWLRSELAEVAPSALFRQIVELLAKIPSREAGWETVELRWSQQPPRTVTSVHQARGVSSALVFREATGRDDVVFGSNRQRARLQHEIDSFSRAELAELDQRLSQTDEDIMRLDHQLRIARYNWSLSGPDRDPPRQEPVVLPEGEQVSERAWMVRTYALDIQGEGIGSLSFAGTLLDDVAGFTLESISVTGYRPYSWNIEGTIYER